MAELPQSKDRIPPQGGSAASRPTAPVKVRELPLTGILAFSGLVFFGLCIIIAAVIVQRPSAPAGLPDGYVSIVPPQIAWQAEQDAKKAAEEQRERFWLWLPHFMGQIGLGAILIGVLASIAVYWERRRSSQV